MISLVTNVDSLDAQHNLSVDDTFQSKTIQQLTSGYRINSSGDDAAGLAIANGYRSSVTELNQGVMNANDGISQLQIIDGGLSNISTILDRMKTLATESASTTFTGSRATLNQEYSQLLTEITRQASNINLNAGGSFNTDLTVYIGGATQQSNASVTVNLSGANNAVDASSLGLASTNVLGGSVSLTNNTQSLTGTGVTFLANGGSQTLTFNLYSGGKEQPVQVTVNNNSTGTGSGLTESDVLSQLNSQLNQYGITAGVNSADGTLQFSGSTAFTMEAAPAATAGTAIVTTGATAQNSSNYIVNGSTSFTASTAAETLNFETSSGTTTVTLAAGLTLAQAIAQINTQTAGSGIFAVQDSGGNGIDFQSANSFSVADTTTQAGGVFGASGAGSTTNASTAPTSGDPTSSALSAITAINDAVQQLGLVQGSVGAGENLLQYAASLAQSQISSFSAAESQIRDADVAAQAANLTKAQVLTQTSVAALAQANSEPQAVLKLLQG